MSLSSPQRATRFGTGEDARCEGRKSDCKKSLGPKLTNQVSSVLQISGIPCGIWTEHPAVGAQSQALKKSRGEHPILMFALPRAVQPDSAIDLSVYPCTVRLPLPAKKLLARIARQRLKGLGRTIASLLFIWNLVDVATYAFARAPQEAPESNLSSCKANIDGRRVRCSYNPHRKDVAFGCHCGWGTYFEDVEPLPTFAQGLALKELKPFCVEHALKRCSVITKPIRVRCRKGKHKCRVTHPSYDVETGFEDLSVSCECGAKKGRGLRWDFTKYEPDSQPMNRKELKEICQTELSICEHSGRHHQKHASLNHDSDPAQRKYKVSCSSDAGMCDLSRIPEKYGLFKDFNWCRCFYATPPSYKIKLTSEVNLVGRCFEQLGACDPSLPHAKANLPEVPIASTPEGDEDAQGLCCGCGLRSSAESSR